MNTWDMFRKENIFQLAQFTETKRLGSAWKLDMTNLVSSSEKWHPKANPMTKCKLTSGKLTVC